MLAHISSDITIYQPTKDVLDWCEKNLCFDNPEYLKKVRMGFWVGNTPKKIRLYKIVGPCLSVPVGVYTFDDFPKVYVTQEIPEKYKIEYGKEIPLREYQKKAVSEMLSHEKGILVSPAGSGKTQIALEIVRKKGLRTLWITHTLDLLNQSRKRAEKYFSKDKIGVIQGGKVDIADGITFATVQTLSKMDMSKMSTYWDMVIVDECHRVSGSPTSVTQFYKVLDNLNATYKYGMTATIHRADGMIKATMALLGKVQYVVPEQSVSEFVLKPNIKYVYTNVRIAPTCLNSDGTLNYGRLINYLCDNDDRNQTIIEKIMSEYENSCIVLSHRVNHLKTLQQMLPEFVRGKSCVIDGKMTSKKDKKLREQYLEEIRSGEKTILFATYSLAKEGLDAPILNRLFMTTPQKDFAIVTQSIGRVSRVHDGKTDATVYDFVDDIEFCVRSAKKRMSIYRKNKCEVK